MEQKKTVKEDGAWPAILVMLFTTLMIMGFLTAVIDTFVCDLHLPEKDGDLKYHVAFPIGILYTLFLSYRYMKQKSIIKNKYQVFRERWGEPEKVSKKNLKILLWYTLITTVGLLLFAIVIGTLNKHGYFEGCRLFP